MSEQKLELGPIATGMLYEDEQVRIWDQRLAPGESTAPHRHERGYALVNVAGDRVSVEPLPGHNNRDFSRPFELAVKRGEVFWIQRGSVERALNVGDQPYRAILVEFKD